MGNQMSEMLTGAATVGRRDVLTLLSEAAKRALSSTIEREGATVQGPAVAVQELQMAGYAGPKRGITRAGLIARDRIVEAMYAEMF